MIEAEIVVGEDVCIRERDFIELLKLKDSGLVVTSKRGIFSTSYRYKTSHKGFGFICDAKEPLDLPGGLTVIKAKKIYSPIDYI